MTRSIGVDARLGSVRVGYKLLDRVGFTNHAIERFATRAALGCTERHVVESIVRGLLLREGWVVSQRPSWARSRNEADLYLQLGEWMLFIGCHDRCRDGAYWIVTVVNGPSDNTWRTARRRGYVSTPPPMPLARRRPAAIVSVVRAVRGPRPGESLPAAVRRIHSARRQAAQAEYDRAVLRRWRERAR